MQAQPLFTPIELGGIELKNRIVMAPMTRSRAIGNVPNELMARYYGLRAAAGLIVAEGTSPSPNGLGYPRIPGIFSPAQVAGWRQVTQAVHAGAGRIFVQLMHTGRVGHPANLPPGAKLLAPSAIAAPGEIWTDTQGMQPYPTPSAMSEADIATAIEEFAQGCRNAIEAGFDGVELHGANGYLIDQFLNTASNQRDDRWGGSIENRIRFAVEVARAAAAAIGAHRVGMRISPYGVFNGMQPDADTDALYVRLAQELSDIGLVYLHIVDHSSMGAPEVPMTIKTRLREVFKHRYILSGGYDAARANADLAAGRCDLVAFGRPFIANPDLVERLRTGAPLKTPDERTFYTPGPEGYTEL
ncbi:MAG: alkene reductase [Fulvimonas sp.]|nr:alkene reductase [Fulvimonas sp.]